MLGVDKMLVHGQKRGSQNTYFKVEGDFKQIKI